MWLRPSLFARVLLWALLNVALVGALLTGFFALQFRLDTDSFLFAGNRLQYVVARLSTDSRSATTPEARSALLHQYSSTYDTDFLLFDEEGTQLAGTKTELPASVLTLIKDQAAQNRPPWAGQGRPGMRGDGPPPADGSGPRPPDRIGPPPPGGSGPPSGESGAPPGGPGSAPRTGGGGGGRNSMRPPNASSALPQSVSDALGLSGRGQRGRDGMPPGQPIFREYTSSPTRYWVGMRLPFFEPGERRPSLAVLVVASDSAAGHGLFFDIRPWLFVSAAIVLLSAAIWFPFVRGLTRSIWQMTATAEEMARGKFDARVASVRSDELGRLGAAINQLSARLGGFVGGQRRFLGDISHELNSPLARLDVALGIVEERVSDDDRSMVADAQDEVRLMSELVAELLAFAKAGMKEQVVRLAPVVVRQVCDAVVAREAQGDDVAIDVPDDLTVTAQPQLLARALANLVRNAVRYAGHAGPITVAARASNGDAVITVRDCGPGVPAEAIPRLFEPFFRIEADRDRATGGAGLGLAIVKTCVDACQGKVEARNLSPGFEVELRLRRA
jgi:two-component system, OmpR family, sensor histidine kinase CpxA